MQEIKFRAVIADRNATILFTLQDLVKPNPLFSIRELLIPWLLEGNQPEMKEKLEVMKFQDGPLADLIWELEIEAAKWCRENCPEVKGFFAKLLNPCGRIPCFENPVFHLEQIEKCRKIPKLYRLYWKAKGKNIRFVSPLVIYKEVK